MPTVLRGYLALDDVLQHVMTLVVGDAVASYRRLLTRARFRQEANDEATPRLPIDVNDAFDIRKFRPLFFAPGKQCDQ